MKQIFTTLTLLTLTIASFAQGPNLAKQGGTLSVGIPFVGYSNWDWQYIYPASTFNFGTPVGGQITRIYIRTQNSGSCVLGNFTIRLSQSTLTNINGAASPGNFLPMGNVHFSASSYTMNFVANTWTEIILNTPFTYNPAQSIVVTWNYTSGSGTTPQCFYTTHTDQTRVRYSTGPNQAQGFSYTNWNDIGFLVITSAPAMPIANFFNPPSVCDNSPVSLINTSTTSGWNIAYNWTITPSTFSYTSGTNATSKTPVVNFNTTGNYTVKLRVSNNVGADSVTRIISVGSPTLAPVADFYGSRRIAGAATMIVPFFDLSTNCPQQWQWTSPDYEAAHALNPFLNPTLRNSQAFFVFPGTWDICLKATNTIGDNTVCKSDYMKIVPQSGLCTDTISRETEGFITDEGGLGNTYGNNRTLVNCKGYLIDPCASSVTLNFEQIKLAGGAGDSIFIHNGVNQNAPRIAAFGSSSNGTFPVVTANSGKMFIYMTTDANGQTLQDSGFIARWTSVGATYGKPTASFNLPSVKGFVRDTFFSGYPINFTNTSTGIDIRYIWDVNGDGNNDSTVANPRWVQLVNFSTSPLTYSIRLIASNCKGFDTLIKNIVIMPVTVKPNQVDFIADKINVAPGDTVTLRDLSTGATAWEWTISGATVNYIPGTNRFSESPKVLVQASGCIDVKLKVSNTSGVDSLTKTCYLKGINYCVPGIATILNSDVGISNVSLGTINNSSQAGTTVYHNYFDSSFGGTVLYKGVPYTLSISRPTNVDPVTRRAWIDFNLDGVFSSNELIANENSSTNLTSTFNFTVPNSALTGLARMRIGTTYGSNFIDPCATFMGEFEDYKIVLERDTIKPVITLLGADTVSIEVNSTYTDAGATATDNFESSASITAKLQYSTDLDVTRVGFYRACYDVTDNYGNKADTKCRVVAVKVDMTPPVITMNGSTPVTIHVFSSYTDAGATANDNYSGNLTNQIKTVNPVDTATVGTYTVTYFVQDFFGFTDTKTRVVNVVDTVKPIVTARSTSTYMHQVCTPLIDSLVIAVSDNYYKTFTINRTGSININAPGTYTLTYTATDGSGNTSSQLQVNVQVADITPPALSINSPDTIVLEVFAPFTEPSFTATDINCSVNSNVTITRSQLPNKNVLGTYTYTITATDASNNSTSKSLVVVYRDTQKPVVTLINGSLVNWPLGKPWVDPGYGVIDNYYSEQQLKDSVKINGVVNTSINGIYTLTYKVTDLSGNTSDEVTREVYVGVTSVEENIGALAKMYPNPSSGIINFELNAGVEQATLQILNILGQVVYTSEISSTNRTIDLTPLAAGNYFVRFSSDNQTVTSKLVLTK